MLIDGNHLFDYVLTDLFFAEKLLSVGGTVMLDDVSPTSGFGVFAVQNFLEANYRHFEKVPVPPGARFALYRKIGLDARGPYNYVPFQATRDPPGAVASRQSLTIQRLLRRA